MSSGAILVLNGYPGVGKLTAAKVLQKLLPNSKIIDTGKFDSVTSSLYDSHKEKEGYSRIQKGLRDTVLSTIIDPSLSSQTFSAPIYILTEIQLSTTSGLNQLKTYASLTSQGFTVIHFILSCSTEINVQRFLSSSSSLPHGSGSKEGLDELGLRELRMEDEIGHFGPFAAKKLGIKEYELDTSALSPNETASMIGEYSLDILREKGWWIQLNNRSRTR